VFIHDALDELITCGETDISISLLKQKITHFHQVIPGKETTGFDSQFQLLEQVSRKPVDIDCDDALQSYNRHKNRYPDRIPYNISRARLRPSGTPGSEYINASFIDGYKIKNAYIATQGPLQATVHDFWRMVWEQKSSCIIMLTNCVEKGRPKCHQYWPQSGSMTVGELTITIIDQQTLSYYTIRTFKMNMDKESREIKQFHYTAWPDFGVPDHPNPMISFIRRVNHMKHEGPDIVHCSAGVGRSGTYIAIQSMMAMIEAEGKVDVFNFVLDMRHKRNYMVQTEVQYMFVHDSLVELIRVGYTDLTVSEFPKVLKELNHTETDSDVSPIEQQFDKLNSLDIPIPSQFISATLPVNKTKNRFQYVLPYEAYRVRLLMLPGVHGSDYINASYVDGYLRCNQFILTQGPMSNTVDDFWRMVWETRVSAIVMLCQLHENGKEQSVRYWPTDKLTQYGDIFIETQTENDTGFYIIRELQMTHTKQGNDVRVIKQFHFNDWSEDRVPETSAALIDMIGLVQKAHHLFGGGPVVVHDSSSVGRAGTFCVLNIVIERLKVEGLIDVFFTVHSLRRKHPGIITTFDQYKFCYQTVLDYLNSFDKYANFD
jgi:netrin-G3 ligand